MNWGSENIIQNYIDYENKINQPASTFDALEESKISSEQETHLRELTPAGRQYIHDHFSSNPYILWLSKIMLDIGLCHSIVGK